MGRKYNYYVSRKNVLTWLMALCLVSSAVARIVIACVKGAGDALTVWSQIVLPIAATLLYVLIVLVSGKERFYKAAIPVWMIALYYGFAITAYPFSKMVIALYWIAIVFFAFLYTQITAGRAAGFWLLPLFACPLCALLYLNRAAITAGDWSAAVSILPDILLLVGWVLLVFAIHVYPSGQYHPTWGDRSDGRRLRSLPPMSQITPYIMVTRNSADNLFTDALEITNVERYIRQKRREGMPNFGLMHVILATYLRTLCKYPGVNRFLSGQKVYSRGDDVQFCLTVKKEMSASAPDTCIKVHFDRHDTTADVYRKLNAQIEEVKNTPLDSSFDNTAHLLTMIPGVFLKFTMWMLRTLDYFGLIPRFLLEVSPFHGSIFLTNLGSIGIPPVYHHLYDFGNLPVFGAFGCKRHAAELQEDGTIVERKYLDVKFTLDERIVDGYYYATFFKQFKRIFRHPELLDLPPEEVIEDIP